MYVIPVSFETHSNPHDLTASPLKSSILPFTVMVVGVQLSERSIIFTVGMVLPVVNHLVNPLPVPTDDVAYA